MSKKFGSFVVAALFTGLVFANAASAEEAPVAEPTAAAAPAPAAEQEAALEAAPTAVEKGEVAKVEADTKAAPAARHHKTPKSR